MPNMIKYFCDRECCGQETTRANVVQELGYVLCNDCKKKFDALHIGLEEFLKLTDRELNVPMTPEDFKNQSSATLR